jgi:hypothetical protein
MRFKRLTEQVILVFLIYSAGAPRAGAPLASAQIAPPTSRPVSQYEMIELKAQQADPNNRQSIRDLAHEILVSPHFHHVPDPVSIFLEDKLTDAEIEFRNHNGHAVSETQLVELMSWMADKFRMPSYLRTTAAQVRTLRMRLAIASPLLMGSTLAGQEVKIGGQIRTKMSPLQAMHLLNVLIDQKIANPDYQDPSIDIDTAQRQREEGIRKVSPTGARVVNGKLAWVTSDNNPKRKEILNALSAALDQMSMQDAYDIINHALETLQLD